MQDNTNGQVYAGFFARLAAYLLDWLIVGTVLLVVRIPIWAFTISTPGNFLVKDFIFKYSIKDILLYLLGVTYFVLLTYFTGATLGKRAMRLRVVSSEERELTFFEVAYRESVGRFLSTVIIYIGYFMMGPDSEKRALHDRLADTRVVYYHVREVEVPPEIRYRHRPPIYRNVPPNGQNGMPTPPMYTPVQQPQTENQVVTRQSAQPGVGAGSPFGYGINPVSQPAKEVLPTQSEAQPSEPQTSEAPQVQPSEPQTSEAPQVQVEEQPREGLNEPVKIPEENSSFSDENF